VLVTHMHLGFYSSSSADPSTSVMWGGNRLCFPSVGDVNSGGSRDGVTLVSHSVQHTLHSQ